MNIPKEFQVFGRKIITEFKADDFLAQREMNNGACSHTEGKIYIGEKDNSGYTSDEDFRFQVYCHEVIHHWLRETRWDLVLKELFSEDTEGVSRYEQFVDNLGKCLHQFLITKK